MNRTIVTNTLETLSPLFAKFAGNALEYLKTDMSDILVR